MREEEALPTRSRLRAWLMSERNLTLSQGERRGGGAPVFSSVPQSVERQGSSGTPQDFPSLILPSLISPPLAVTQAPPPEPTSRSSVDLQLHGDLAEVEQEWKAFETRAERTGFQAFDWLAKWQR